MGQLGLGDVENRYVPIKHPLKGVVHIACAYNFSMAFTNNGKIFIWGLNVFGQNRLSPELLKLEFKPKLVSGKINYEWKKLFYWIFLGKRDQGSVFCQFHSEIVVDMVKLVLK